MGRFRGGRRCWDERRLMGAPAALPQAPGWGIPSPLPAPLPALAPSTRAPASTVQPRFVMVQRCRTTGPAHANAAARGLLAPLRGGAVGREGGAELRSRAVARGSSCRKQSPAFFDTHSPLCSSALSPELLELQQRGQRSAELGEVLGGVELIERGTRRGLSGEGRPRRRAARVRAALCRGGHAAACNPAAGVDKHADCHSSCSFISTCSTTMRDGRRCASSCQTWKRQLVPPMSATSTFMWPAAMLVVHTAVPRGAARGRESRRREEAGGKRSSGGGGRRRQQQLAIGPLLPIGASLALAETQLAGRAEPA